MSEIVIIGSIIIFHLGNQWIAKFFILSDDIFLVRLQGKFSGSERVELAAIIFWKVLVFASGKPALLSMFFTKFFFPISVERRRRFNINDRIKELGTMLPKQDS